MDVLERIEGKEAGEWADIYPDLGAESPREWDNVGEIVHVENRHFAVGDRTVTRSAFEEFYDIVVVREDVVWMPVYAYVHSGVVLGTSAQAWPFNDRWDAGLCGVIWATHERIKVAMDVPEVTEAVKRQVDDVFRQEIETLNQYLRGDVYGYVIKEICPTCEQEKAGDSCWGFFGIDNVRQAARSALGLEEDTKDAPAVLPWGNRGQAKTD